MSENHFWKVYGSELVLFIRPIQWCQIGLQITNADPDPGGGNKCGSGIMIKEKCFLSRCMLFKLILSHFQNYVDILARNRYQALIIQYFLP